MRTAFLLCLAALAANVFMVGASARSGNWDAFWPWLGLLLSNAAHGAHVVLAWQRYQSRQRAEVELRAMFSEAHREHAHQREEREAALRGVRP